MPSTLDDFLAWSEAYRADHGGEAGTVNDETLEQAVANREWGREFAAREGRAPSQQDYENHYYRDQLPESKGFQRNLAQANDILDQVMEEFATGGQGGSDTHRDNQLSSGAYLPGSPYAAWQNAEAEGRRAPARTRVTAPYAPVVENVNRAMDVVGGVLPFGNRATQQPLAYQMPFETGSDYPFLQEFGANPNAHGYGEAGHLGADWLTPAGTPIQPIAPGEVVFAGMDGTGWGNSVVIQHPDGSTSRYSHLSEIGVQPGQMLGVDDLVGQSGNSGNFWSTDDLADSAMGGSNSRWDGSHLDLTMTDPTGNYVDPLEYFGNPYGWATETPVGSNRTSGVSAPARAQAMVPNYGTPYDEIFYEAGQTYGVDPALLVAMARQESGPSFNSAAVSPVGAGGVLQLMPGTAADMNVQDVFDPYQNIMGGARYLDYLSDYGNTDNPYDLLWMYNAGPGNYTNGIRPSETEVYLDRILNTYYPQYSGR